MKLKVAMDASEGFHVLHTYGSWSVAVFNRTSSAESVVKMQRHLATDECFLLSTGGGTLITADEQQDGNLVFSLMKLEKGKLYTVPKGTWHAHSLQPCTTLFIVEDSFTSLLNTENRELKPAERMHLKSLSP